MAQTTWTQDTPSGVYKNHALSAALYESAIAESVFMDYVAVAEGFGRKRGESVTLTRYSQPTEPVTGRLVETERIPEDMLALSTVPITVSEFGRGIPFTNLYEELSEFDITVIVQKVLRNQIALVMDTAVATAFKTCKLKYTPTGVASSNVATNGVFGATAAAGLNVYHVEEITGLLYDTYFVPPYAGGDYMAICRHTSIQSLYRDPSWEKWHVYTNPQAKYNEELGRLHNARFVKTNHANALGKVGTGSVLGECVFFGEDGVAMAEAMTPELRVGVSLDGGRSNVVYWYGIFDFGLVWDTANAGEARVMHVGSL